MRSVGRCRYLWPSEDVPQARVEIAWEHREPGEHRLSVLEGLGKIAESASIPITPVGGVGKTHPGSGLLCRGQESSHENVDRCRSHVEEWLLDHPFEDRLEFSVQGVGRYVLEVEVVGITRNGRRYLRRVCVGILRAMLVMTVQSPLAGSVVVERPTDAVGGPAFVAKMIRMRSPPSPPSAMATSHGQAARETASDGRRMSRISGRGLRAMSGTSARGTTRGAVVANHVVVCDGEGGGRERGGGTRTSCGLLERAICPAPRKWQTASCRIEV